VYIIGFAIDPLLAAPLSEMYGCAVVYHISNVFFLVCTAGCALSVNVGMFIALFITFRFLSGLVGAVPLALGGSSIGYVILITVGWTRCYLCRHYMIVQLLA
jgi:MFS family permease